MKHFLYPMLATPATPFDAEDYLFEVKWDGVRALASLDEGHWRLWGRTGSDYTGRYPELAVLRRLPAGTVVDGELVVLQGGRADFPALLQRHQRQVAGPLDAVSQRLPIHYLVFDLLCHEGRSLLKEPLHARRARLRDLLVEMQEPLLAFSDGIVGQGRDFFARVVAQGHEGVMAKSPHQQLPAGQTLAGLEEDQACPSIALCDCWLSARARKTTQLAGGYGACRDPQVRGTGKPGFERGDPGRAVRAAGETPPVKAAGVLPRAGLLGGARDLLPRALPGLDVPTADCAMPFSTAGSKARSSPEAKGTHAQGIGSTCSESA